jgi:hypothetical protein
LKTISYLLLFLFSSLATVAQIKSTSTDNQIWMAYYHQTRLSHKWGIWTDLHLRTKDDFTSNFSTGIVRLGLTYYATDNTRLTAGYAFVNHFPADARKISQPEHRPWQQIQWNTTYSKLRTSQAIRLEERFRRKIANDESLTEGYLFNYRLRYNFLVSVPLGKRAFEPRSFAFVINDEVHLNFGKEVVYNYFDQNRLFLGFTYQINKTNNIQFGYMNFFQQQAAGYRYKIINAVRVYYIQTLDLRRGR